MECHINNFLINHGDSLNDTIKLNDFNLYSLIQYNHVIINIDKFKIHKFFLVVNNN